MFEIQPRPPAGPPEMSVGEAKARLREWGVEADVALSDQVHSYIAAAKGITRGVTPWLAGAMVLGGLLAGRGKKRDRAEGHRLGLIGIITSAVSVARIVLPLASVFFSKRRED